MNRRGSAGVALGAIALLACGRGDRPRPAPTASGDGGSVSAATAGYGAGPLSPRWVADITDYGDSALVSDPQAVPMVNLGLIVLAGLTVSNVVGVPAGAAIGNLFGWRTTFWAMCALGVLASSALIDYVQRLLEASRAHAEIRVGLSPRAGLAILAAARAQALLAGRSYVLPEDVQAVFPYIATHRLNLGASARSGRAAIVARLLEATAVR